MLHKHTHFFTGIRNGDVLKQHVGKNQDTVPVLFVVEVPDVIKRHITVRVGGNTFPEIVLYEIVPIRVLFD
jgi:hypothetical protein